MICLTLSMSTLAGWADTVGRYSKAADCFEFRVDLLDKVAPADVAELSRGIEKPVILTVRRRCDGGAFSGSEAERRELIATLLDIGSFDYVDLEGDIRGTDGGTSLAASAASRGVVVIRSHHDFDATPTDVFAVLESLPAGEGEVPKLAVTPQGTGDLHRILRAYAPARRRFPAGFILLGMGRFGFPSRILANAFGGLLTFTSAPGAEAAPGHIDPETMRTVYHVHKHTLATRIFGIIGNPVLHSQSPHYHNPRFLRDGFDAVYVPFPTDDVDEFFILADTAAVEAFSVTIPHKEAVLAHLIAVDEATRAAGACNTVVRGETGFRGVNTDVPGFLTPLRRQYAETGLSGKRATVIGAGGAARAVCYALAVEGVSVLVLNRTLERAAQLVEDIARIVGTPGIADGIELAAGPLRAEGFGRAREFSDIIVQTTGVGMEPDVDADPAPSLSFTGKEVVYDIIYTPEYTSFLRRAQAAGCRVITGRAMFDGQAREQYRLFRSRILKTTSRRRFP